LKTNVLVQGIIVRMERCQLADALVNKHLHTAQGSCERTRSPQRVKGVPRIGRGGPTVQQRSVLLHLAAGSLGSDDGGGSASSHVVVTGDNGHVGHHPGRQSKPKPKAIRTFVSKSVAFFEIPKSNVRKMSRSTSSVGLVYNRTDILTLLNLCRDVSDQDWETSLLLVLFAYQI
jgi:hypothetical protein